MCIYQSVDSMPILNNTSHTGYSSDTRWLQFYFINRNTSILILLLYLFIPLLLHSFSLGQRDKRKGRQIFGETKVVDPFESGYFGHIHIFQWVKTIFWKLNQIYFICFFSPFSNHLKLKWKSCQSQFQLDIFKTW